LPWAVRLALLLTRIKEVASVQGVRSNQLVGYGLVVGLDGTGDQTTQAPVHGAEPAGHAAADGHHAAAGTNMQPRTWPR
jgi:flagellar P-ring protein precursor FlgI